MQAVVGGWSAEARRELHSQPVQADAERVFSADAMRDLKGSAPAPTDQVDDDLSPLRGVR